MEIKLIDGQNVWRCPLEICMETKHWILVMAGETQRFSNSAIYKKNNNKKQQKNQKEKTQRKQQNTPEAPLVTAVLYRVAFALLFV